MADTEIFNFDIGPDGLTLTNLHTGQINEGCTPPDYYIYGGQLTYNGPFPVGSDGSFEIKDAFVTTIGGVATNETVDITGHVANGIAAGTLHVENSFYYYGQYDCTDTQSWTASKTS